VRNTFSRNPAKSVRGLDAKNAKVFNKKGFLGELGVLARNIFSRKGAKGAKFF
jgi:hypothetical protein